MRDIRDIFAFYIDLCDECNPPADVLELDACPDSESGVEAYIRPEMLHHSCAVKVSIPRNTNQEDVVALLQGIAQRLSDDPTFIESAWQSRDDEAEAFAAAEPTPGHMH